MAATTLYWHDYETFGADPVRDRPSQFAGLRTDPDLNIIGEPLVIYCKPSDDMLPQPQACLITGITPQLALEKGINEAEFIDRIQSELAKPGTCGVGYNSIRFDDEFTRYTLYRNFFDPYAREWQNGNSRWDIIDMARLCYALRPDGIQWPKRDDGLPSFRLEDLSTANGISHVNAHDALADVEATIAMAKLIKDTQPRLYNYLFEMRKKQEVAKHLNIKDQQPLIHSSSMFPSEYGCTTIVVPIAKHPTNNNGIIVYDLRHSPEELLTLTAEEIRERLFTKTVDLPEGVERVHLKTIHTNKCPAIAPTSTLTSAAEQRIQLSLATANKHLQQLQTATGLSDKIQTAVGQQVFQNSDDPEHNLYGGFVGDADRAIMEKIRQTPPAELDTLKLNFEDARLPELFFRYKARNWPEILKTEEQARWEAHRIQRITQAGGSITLQEFEEQLQTLAANPDITEKQMNILEELAEYGANVITSN